MNGNKVPCGGFYLGDGLTLSGGVLSSSSKSGYGNNIKWVVVDPDGVISEESDCKTFDELQQAFGRSEIIYMVYSNIVLNCVGIDYTISQNPGVIFNCLWEIKYTEGVKKIHGHIYNAGIYRVSGFEHSDFIFNLPYPTTT